MGLVFHYAPFSSAVTVHWALEELGVPYEKVKVDLKGSRDQVRPAFQKLNPNAKVPTLVDDGVPVFESAAIIIHLGERFGVDKGLFPKAGLERAPALKWIVWTNASFNEALSRFLHNTAEHVPAERRNAKAGEVGKVDVEKHLDILDGELAGKTWLVGDTFSLVDVHLIGWVAYAAMCGFDLAKWTNIDAWVKRGQQRPGFGVAMSP